MGGENSSFEHWRQDDSSAAVDTVGDADDAISRVDGAISALNPGIHSADDITDSLDVETDTHREHEDDLTDVNILGTFSSTHNDDINISSGIRQRSRRHSLDGIKPPQTRPASEDDGRSRGAWNIFSQIKASIKQFGAGRSPGIYDDKKTTVPGTRSTNFNNNDVYGDVNQIHSNGLTSLTRAIREGNVAEVEAILQHPGVKTELREAMPYRLGSNYREPDRTPVLVAVQAEHVEITKLLLEAGASVNATDRESYSALYYAADGNNPKMVKLLLDYRPVLESPVSYKDPLFTACRHGNKEVVKLLLDAGCTINRPTDSEQPSILIAAMESSSEDLCLQLIQRGANVVTDNNISEPLIAACQYNYPSVVKACIEAGCDINMRLPTGICPVAAAVKLCNFQDDKAALYGSSCEHSHQKAREIFLKRMSIVQLLCDNGLCVNDVIHLGDLDRVSVLATAIRNNNLPCAYVLLKHGARWDTTCHRYLVRLYNSLSKKKHNRSEIELMQLTFIPIIVNTLHHTDRMNFLRETTQPFLVQSLKECSRHVIRTNIRHPLGTSILPLVSTLDLPKLLSKYLCYDEICEKELFN